MHAYKNGEKLSLYMLVRCNVVLILNERSTVHDVKKGYLMQTLCYLTLCNLSLNEIHEVKEYLL